LIKQENYNLTGCPVRIRTSIDGVRVRSLTFRRRGINQAREIGAGLYAVNVAAPAFRGSCSCPPAGIVWRQVPESCGSGENEECVSWRSVPHGQRRRPPWLAAAANQ